MLSRHGAGVGACLRLLACVLRRADSDVNERYVMVLHMLHLHACTAAVLHLRDLAHQLIFGQQHRQLLKVRVSVICRGAPRQGL